MRDIIKNSGGNVFMFKDVTDVCVFYVFWVKKISKYMVTSSISTSY